MPEPRPDGKRSIHMWIKYADFLELALSEALERERQLRKASAATIRAMGGALDKAHEREWVLREVLCEARGYVEEPGEPGTEVVTTEESAVRSKALLARIDAALSTPAPPETDERISSPDYDGFEFAGDSFAFKSASPNPEAK